MFTNYRKHIGYENYFLITITSKIIRLSKPYLDEEYFELFKPRVLTFCQKIFRMQVRTIFQAINVPYRYESK